MVAKGKDTVSGAAVVQLATHDVEPIVDAVQEVFGHHVVLACGAASGKRSLYARSSDEFLIGDLRYASDFFCLADEPRDTLILSIPRQSSGGFGKQSYEAGDVLAFNPDWMGRLEFREPGHISNVVIPISSLRYAARVLAGCDFDEVPVFDAYLPRDRTESVRALEILEFLHTAAPGTNQLNRAREMWAMTELLSLWPHSLSRHVHGVGSAAPSSIRKALEFIDSNFDRPITLIDIAQAAHIGLRALNDGFNRHIGESPARYLRNRRLDAAYAALRTGGSATVTEVATMLQFGNTSTFARSFYKRFGRMPGVVRRGT